MEETRKIRISVRNLVEFLLRSGDIDQRRGSFGEKEAMQEGSRIHRKIQGKMGSGYQAEVPLSVQLPGDGYLLVIEGRADGIFREIDQSTGQERVFVDEIKGVYRDVLSMEHPVPVHLAQAKCYAWMYGQREKTECISVQMTYCSLETEEIRRFCETYAYAVLEEWFLGVAAQYHRWARQQILWEEQRNASIRPLAFPFPWRKGQKDVAASVYRTILRWKTLFIQAPTGTGKTLSTIYPAVKAMGEGLAERIFYATAKTVTRTVAEEAFAILRENGLHMKVVTLTAKEKICFQEETECRPELCPYAKGHYDRVNDAVYELLETAEVIDRAAIEAQARKWQVCPFEMGLDAALWADGLICDYNYLFDPRAKLKRFFGEGVRGEYLFLIDEAHNLVERGREMFSASLYKEDFLAAKREAGGQSRKLSRALNRCNAWMLEKKRTCADAAVLRELGTFPVCLMNLCGVMEEFLEDPRNAAYGEKVLELYFQVRRFLDTCDRLNENYVIYTELCPDQSFLLRLYCVDVSENLQECLDKGRSTVYFSATFLPIAYYKSLLSTADDNYAIYAHSTFDPANRSILIGTDTSSRYTRRSQSEFRRMAEYVLAAVQAKRGNYMVFFPSYQMLEEVAGQFEALCIGQQEKIGIACQQPGMTEAEREAFLRFFEQPHPQGFAGFCVMGGIFGEGVDLRDDRLIGVIVVGTGLPQVCREREILKSFYDQRGKDGFFYAYLCPGMNKVLQSAGRVIRTESDEGVILLLDERFAEGRYRRMFPAEWESPQLCTVQTVGEKLAGFWGQRMEPF